MKTSPPRTNKIRGEAAVATRGEPAKRRRMAPQDRERLIVEEATRYFAEHGLGGGTTELARRIGITQPLLYRYFPTKQALIERVYENLFPSGLAPAWEELIDDTTVPLRNRLSGFYKDYANSVLTYEHVRLFLFSGLSKFDYNTRYYSELSQRIFMRIARALRHEVTATTGLTFPPDIGPEEMELVQSLHGTIYHVGFRRWVYTPPLRADIDRLIERKVDWFLGGAIGALEAMAEAGREIRPDRG
ncbi:TetR/AcrR family transcriptional regulator [Microbaculum marinum]|uniref:TetR/AcrR family transcriptional regulator n=1 Tax=Microbaculum marinum TaxID=1764581 RepID=A0AAW9RD84_9HYPH